MNTRAEFSQRGRVRAALVLLAAFAVPGTVTADDGDDHWRGDVGYVVGSVFTAVDVPGEFKYDFERTYAVVENRGVVQGLIYVYYYEESGGEVYETSYVVEADCLDIDNRTDEAWIGGDVIAVESTFGAPELGSREINYVDSNDGGNPLSPDVHGASWDIPGYYVSPPCEERPEPFFIDYSQRGKVTVQGVTGDDDDSDDDDDDDSDDD